MKKRLVSWLLAAAMVATSVPMSAMPILADELAETAEAVEVQAEELAEPEVDAAVEAVTEAEAQAEPQAEVAAVDLQEEAVAVDEALPVSDEQAEAAGAAQSEISVQDSSDYEVVLPAEDYVEGDSELFDDFSDAPQVGEGAENGSAEDEFANAVEIYESKAVKVELFEGEYGYYKFTPLETGTYVFMSTENEDAEPYMDLYKSKDDEQPNWDGFGYAEGLDYNFYLKRTLDEGTVYYIRTGLYAEESRGSFLLTVKKLPEFKVTWKANGGIFQNAGEEEDPEEYSTKETGYIYINNTPDDMISREGYLLVGWSDSESGEVLNKIQAENESWCYDVDTSIGSVTLYAVWTNDLVDVNWHANGGTFGEGNGDIDTTRVVRDGKLLTNYSEPYNEDESMGFAYWALDAEGTKKLVSDYDNETGRSYFVNVNLSDTVDIYAIWGKKIQVTLNGNGGYLEEDEEGKVYERILTRNSKLPLYTYNTYVEPEIQDNKRFVGWSASPDGQLLEIKNNSEGSYFDLDISSGKDITLYAIWVDLVKVTWDANGGIIYNDDGDREKQEVERVEKGTNDLYYRNAYGLEDNVEFDYWARDPEGTQRIPVVDGLHGEVLDITVEGDMTLYAIYKKYPKITLNANGGHFLVWPDDSEDPVKSETHDVVLWDNLFYVNYSYDIEPEENSAKVFAGWAYDAEGKEKISKNVKIEDGKTIFAVWTTETVDITWDANEGVFGNGEKEFVQTVIPCSELKAEWYSAAVEGLSAQEGKLFSYWALDKEGTKPLPYSEEKGSFQVDLNTNTTIYAIWADTVKITLNAGAGQYIFEEEDDEIIYQKELTVEIRQGGFLSPDQMFVPDDAPEGEAFAYWSLDEDGKTKLETVYDQNLKGYIFDIDTSKPRTIYAIWTNSTTTVKWYENYPDRAPGNYEEMKVARDGYLQKEGNHWYAYQDDQEKEWMFAYWAKDPEGKQRLSKKVVPGIGECFDVDLTQDEVSLYAIWTEPVSFTMYANGGQFGRAEKRIELVAEGKILDRTMISEPEYPDRSKYFAYWATDPAGNNRLVWDDVQENYGVSVTKGMEIYAIWADAHPLTKSAAQAADCEHNGNIEFYICNECGKYYSDADGVKEIILEDTVVKALGHNLAKVDAKAPTVDAEGNIEYYTCTRCGKLYADANATQEITLASTVLAKLNPEGDVSDPTSAAAVESKIVKLKDTSEAAGSSFAKIQVRSSKQTKNSITILWNKVSGADGYIVYGNLCGNKYKLKRLPGVPTTKNSYVYKKLKKGTYYKFNVVAYKLVNGQKKVLTTSKTIHVATTGGKVTNVSKVTVNNTKVSLSLKKKKSFTIKATAVKQSSKLALKSHRKLKFESSNPKVATVSAKGKIVAKKKGTCYIYVYSQSGTYKRIKVTVKK